MRLPLVAAAATLAFAPSAHAERPPKSVKSEARSVQISSESAGFRWPLNIDEGWLECVPPAEGRRHASVLFHAKKRTFAVNAEGFLLKGTKALDSIWLDEPAIPGAKANLGPLLDRGLALCAKAPR